MLHFKFYLRCIFINNIRARLLYLVFNAHFAHIEKTVFSIKI